MLQEEPVKVSIPKSEESKASTSLAMEINQAKAEPSITIAGPIEDQGVPYEEFIKNSKQYSSNIDF